MRAPLLRCILSPRVAAETLVARHSPFSPIRNKRMDGALRRVPTKPLCGILHEKCKVFGKITFQNNFTLYYSFFRLSKMNILIFEP